MLRDPLDELIEDLEKALPPPALKPLRPYSEVIRFVDSAMQQFDRRQYNPRHLKDSPADPRDAPKPTGP